MSQLIPCSACQRHIRLTDTACPFCSAACSPTRANARAGQLGRSRGLKRAAVFALSAGVSVTACGGESEEQNAVPIYGAPVSPSASVDSPDGASPTPPDASASSDDTETDYTATDATDVGSGDTSEPWDDTGLAQPEYGAPVPPPDDTATDDTATEDDPTLDDAGATDGGAAQDGGDVDGAALPPSQDASLLDPDPGPTVVPLYGAPPTLE